MSQLTQALLSADFLSEQRQLVFPDIGLDTIQPHPEIASQFLSEYKVEYTPDQLQNADVLLSLKPKVTAASLMGIERLAAIGRYGVGYDNVDLRACTESDIAVYITRNAVVRPVASSIVLLVLASSHRLVWKDRLIRSGEWSASTRRLGKEPRNRTVGTIGLGNIAREAVRLLKAFDVGRFVAHDPYATAETAAAIGVELVSLDDLLSVSDYVLINCPLNENTRKLIGERELRLMKKDSVLINTARGPIVDEAALALILEEGGIAFAALDVFEAEPLSPASPLLVLDNTILSSHSLCWTEELFRDMGREAFAGVIAVSQGIAPQNVVNPEVLNRPGFQRKLERFRSASAKGEAG
jgi:phosphoglycerate dehydrogenase-like enzyme